MRLIFPIGSLFLTLVALFFFPHLGRTEELRLITEDSLPSSSHNEPSGINADLIQAIMREVGDNRTIEAMPWSRGYHLALERPDTVIFPTTRTPFRENQFHWVGPLIRIKWGLYGFKDVDYGVKTIEDAKKVSRIGVYRDDVRYETLRGLGFENLDTANNQELTLMKLFRKRVDLIALADGELEAFKPHFPFPLERVRKVLEVGEMEMYFAFSLETDPETVRRWREAFDRLERNGTLDRIRGISRRQGGCGSAQ